MPSYARTFVWLSLLVGATALTSVAEARQPAECQLAWSQAVRSYLTQNRKAGPDGKNPASLDDEELVAQAWLGAFAPACRAEAEGRGPEARIEAATIGVQVLAKLDPRGCERFLEFYMESGRPKDICSVAAQASADDLRRQISGSIPKKN